MDLSTNSIGWHRTRKWLDDTIEGLGKVDTYNEYGKGFVEGQIVALMKVRLRFNTPDESAEVEKTRREMFG